MARAAQPGADLRIPATYWSGTDLRDAPDLTGLPELGRMLEVAGALGSGWDFIRIDLYAVDGEVWFGECTPYPGGGLLRYKPKQFDLDSGRHRQVPTLAWVRPGQP